jgi:guanine deaminase
VHLNHAIHLAVDNVAVGGGPFGAVIVRGQELIATGVNGVREGLDPTAHAEVMAIREACQVIGDVSLAGCTLYASCEPCPMCLAAAMWARLDRVFYAATRDDAAEAGFSDRDFYAELARPPADRVVPCVQLADREAGAPFAAWAARSDRLTY